MLDNQLIDETLLLLTYTDQSRGALGQPGNPKLRVYYDMDDNWYGPLCQVFSRVYRYDCWQQANRIGLAATNREIIEIAMTYHPKYVLWPANRTFVVTEDTLLALRRMGCVVVGRFFDDDYYFEDYSRWLAPSLDYCITNVPERTSQYEALGTRGIFMEVEGHNEAIWQRLPHLPKQYDASFIGAVYASRSEYLTSLKEAGIPVAVFDNDWGRKKLSLYDMARIVNQTKINLNFTGDRDGLGIRQIKGRMFEVAMAGGFLLTEYAPRLEQYFDIGLEVACFKNAAEAAEKTRYYLENADEREEIASRGYHRAQRDYSSRALFRRVFLQIEEDLRKRGRAAPGEPPTGVNPMRQAAAEYYYEWSQLMLGAAPPLRDTWRQSIELALACNPAHDKARQMLASNDRWGDPQGPYVRLLNTISSLFDNIADWICSHARRSRILQYIYAHVPHSAGAAIQWWLDQLHYMIISAHLRLVRLIRGEVPVRLTYWLKTHSLLRAIFRRQNPLTASFHSLGKSLAAPELRQLLHDDVLGEWAVDAPTISVIWRELSHDRPQVILECGSGISTLCLARYAQYLSNESGTGCLVISLEQDAQVKRLVEKRLAESGLDKWVEIIYAPIKVERMDDTDTWNYGFDEALLNSRLGARKADWLLVDGPAGPAACRLGTIPALAGFSHPGARWFLHDAFRDGELKILRKWERFPGIEVTGIYPTGKGLASGYFKDPEAAKREI